MAAEFDDLEDAVTRHGRATAEYVRLEQQFHANLPQATYRRRWFPLILAAVLVLTLPAVVISRAHFISAPTGPPPAVVAFPGAEGFGSIATGGRGGSVIEVTNLNDSGTGSLRAALTASGARTVVFRVGGVISLTTAIQSFTGDLTIAGQTAPGDGIVVRGWHLAFYGDNVIMRGMRIRPTDQYRVVGANANDGVRVGNYNGGGTTYILDHNSISWGSDENLDLYYTPQNITVSYNIISEPLMTNPLSFGGRMDYGYCMNIGESVRRVSVHHNLYANFNERGPLIKGGTDSEVINNVMYNWRNYGTNSTNPEGVTPTGLSNVINNYYKPGPTGQGNPAISVSANSIYANGNFGASNIGSAPVAQQSGMSVQTPAAAFTDVLAGAGATAPARDSTDARIVTHANSGTASLGTLGSQIASQNEVGGMPSYAGGTAPTDTDHDGMPDTWETSHGSDPNNAADRNNIGASGYTLLEDYINSFFP